MRRGKEIAQGSHASSAFMSNLLRSFMGGCKPYISAAEQEWINGSFAKVVLQADSEEILLKIYEAAAKEGIKAHFITDNGTTEFNGVPTITALALGPDYSSTLDRLTGPQGTFPLRLY